MKKNIKDNTPDTPKKKKGGKSLIKKGVRRTIAALLMATALVVAAIPGNPAKAIQDLDDDTTEVDKVNYSVADYTPVSIGGKDYAGLVFVSTASGAFKTIYGIIATENLVEDTVSEDGTVLEEGTRQTVYTLDKDLPLAEITSLNMSNSGVKSVNKDSFKDFSNLQDIVFPPTLNQISDGAFANNSVIRSISGATGVNSIGAKAFENCTNLQAIETDAALSKIGSSAFENCTSLSNFNFSSGLEDNGLGSKAFAGSGIRSANFDEGARLRTIPYGCFMNCTKLTTTSLGGNIDSIDSSAFEGCSALSNATLGDNITNIGDSAFKDCSALGSFRFPANITSSGLGTGILEGCSSLKNVDFSIPALGKVRYQKLPDDIFKNCSSLQQLSLPEGMTAVGTGSLSGCTSLQKMEFPEGFKNVPASLFDKCDNLKDVYFYDEDTQFPNLDPFPADCNVTIYGYSDSTAHTFASNNGYTFVSLNDETVESDFYTIDANGVITGADLSKLLSYSSVINIPTEVNGIPVTGIGPGVFQNSSRLTEVIIPAQVQSVAEKAFADCSKLKVVRFEGDETTFADNSFNNSNPNLTLHGSISDESEPFNRAMEVGLPFEDDTYGIVVERDKNTGENVLTEYDENRSTLVVPTGVDSFGTKSDGSAVGTSIFEGNDNLTNVQIYGAIRLDDHQFKDCRNLESVYLPDTLAEIGIAPFYGCEKLGDLTIEPANPRYVCDGGIIYELEEGEKRAIVESLPGYMGNDNFTIPASVTKLYEEAFASPQNISTVYFSSGVSKVPERCFYDSEITEVFLTDAVEYVDKNAFSDSDGEKPYLTRLHVANPYTVISDSASDGVYGLTLYGDEQSTAHNYANHYEQSRNYKFEVEDNGSGRKDDPSSSSDPSGSSSSSGSSSGSSSASSSKKSSSKKSSSKKKKSSSKKKKSSSKKKSTNNNNNNNNNNSNTTATAASSSAAPVVQTTTGYVPSAASPAGTAGNTPVDTTGSGIDNTDLVSGSIDNGADNYVIKITQTDEATAAFEEALRNRFGSLDNIRYYPMDISLYDSTGTTKIEDPKVDVTITLPLPDELSLYGGNNHVAAVGNGSLEELGTRFSSIDGTPCVTFTASHFSPYGIYVDLTNLSAGNNLDANPKTGDPINPKWFFVVGLAALSIFLI